MSFLFLSFFLFFFFFLALLLQHMRMWKRRCDVSATSKQPGAQGPPCSFAALPPLLPPARTAYKRSSCSGILGAPAHLSLPPGLELPSGASRRQQTQGVWPGHCTFLCLVPLDSYSRRPVGGQGAPILQPSLCQQCLGETHQSARRTVL